MKKREIIDICDGDEEEDVPCAKKKQQRPRRGPTQTLQAILVDHDSNSDDHKKPAAGAATAATNSADAADLKISLLCTICGDDEDTIVQLGHCHHACCLSCLRGTVRAKKHRPTASSRCPEGGCRLPLACTDVLHVLAPKDYDIYATHELEQFNQARQKRQEHQELSCCPLCGDVGEMGGGKGQRRVRDNELDLVLMQKCGACNVVFCSLCQTTLTLAEAKATRWPEVHEHACPCLLLTRVLALNEATRVLLVETGASKKERGDVLNMLGGVMRHVVHSSQAEKRTWAKGTGFGGEYESQGNQQVAPEELQAVERQAQNDNKVRSLLAEGWLPCLTTIVSSSSTPLLPALHHVLGGSFDMTSKTMIVNGSTPLLQLLRLYLRNDSFYDMSARRDLYAAVLAVPRTLALHPFLAHVLTKGLEDEGGTGKAANAILAKESSIISGNSIISLLEKLQKQADYFQRCADRKLVIDKNEEQEALAKDSAFATQIRDSVNDIRRRPHDHEQHHTLESKMYHAIEGKLGHEERQHRQLPSRPYKSDDPTKAAVQIKYTQLLRTLAFDSAPLLSMVTELKQGTYSYLKDAQSSGGTGDGNRIRRIMREIASLSKSLPVEQGTGIFVRVDEDRPDVIKALVSGPEDTPYAGGLLEFDIFLPAGYPEEPPNVRLLTKGNRVQSINPNLYSDDRKVLISIQSLILVSEPHYNEPGFEQNMHTDQGKEQSEMYNREVRSYTMEHTILGMMKSPPPVFKDVVRQHFALKRGEIIAHCREWERFATHIKPLTKEVIKAAADAQAAVNDHWKDMQNKGGGGISGWLSSLWSGGGTPQVAQQPYPQVDYNLLQAEPRHKQATNALQETTRLRKEIEAFYACC